MKVIIDEAGEIIAKATDDHTLIGGHHRLSVAASLGKRLFWRERTCKFSSIFSLSRSPSISFWQAAGTEAVKATEAVHARDA